MARPRSESQDVIEKGDGPMRSVGTSRERLQETHLQFYGKKSLRKRLVGVLFVG